MENNTQKEIEQIEKFKNTEIVSKFDDNKFIFKIAGENIWYLVDANGNTIPRIRANGTEEFSTVDFYDMAGEPYSVEFGQLKEGYLVAKILTEQDGMELENYYGISPSGYAYKSTSSGFYQRFGLNFRLDEQLTAREFIRIPVWDFRCKEYLDFLYDIAQNHLITAFNKFLQTKPKGSYKQRERIYFTAAKNMSERYAFVQNYLEKKEKKQGTKTKPTQAELQALQKSEE